MVLVLGILGIVFCFILGIIAWVMGNTDLAAMRAGTMDPSGEGLTQAGRICGIIAVVKDILGICVGTVLLVLFALGSAAAAVGGPAGQ